MRHRYALPARGLILVALPALLGACSTTVTREPITTSSIAPRPPEGMVRGAPPPYIETGSLGDASWAPMPPEQRYRWRDTPPPASPMRLAPPMEQPARWQGAPYPGTADGRPPGTHVIVVREGDTLYSLSRHYRVSLADIIAANRLDHGKIEIGQRLTIPPSRYALVGPRG